MKLYFFQSLLIFTINLTYSQTWDYKIFNDNVYELRDRWGDSQKYLAKFYVYNDSISYIREAKKELFSKIDTFWGNFVTFIDNIADNNNDTIGWV